MLQHARPAIVMLALFTALLGLAYPLAITGIAGLAMPNRADGSLVRKDGVIIGSAVIGQDFTSARYFHGRPSATSAPDPKDESKTIDAPYNAANSSGSNLGPTSQKLVDRVRAEVASLRTGGLAGPVPADAATTSASGLDPEISPAFAKAQVARVARARGLPADRLQALVDGNATGRLFDVVGEPRVNVLRLNLALDALPSS
jgi:K+-transporting ATPase ATPase C chain